MSIQEHLNKIRNAVYGHEVRESIAKGIETAYDDASEKDNANMEVKVARGTHPNLRSRLEEVDDKQQQTTTQLAQKASREELESGLNSKVGRGENEIISMAMLNPDIKEAINAGEWNVSVNTSDLEDGAATFSKRTKIGHYPTIIIGAGGKSPNYDSENAILEMNDGRFIVIGKTRHQLAQNSSLDLSSVLSSSTNAVVFLDTETNLLRGLPSFNLTDVKESEVAIASISLTHIISYPVSEITDFNIGCKATIDNKEITPYNTSEDRSVLGELGQVYIGYSGFTPDFNTSTKKLMLPDSIFIAHRGARYLVETGGSIDFSNDFLGATSVIAYYDVVNQEIKTYSLVSIGTGERKVSENEVMLLLIYETSEGFRMNISTDYKINGRFIHEQTPQELENPFNLVRTFLDEYPTKTLPGIEDEDSPFDYTNDNHTLIYSLFDDFVENNGDYITRTEMGRTEHDDIPIYEYDFNPKRPLSSGGASPVNYPTILLGASIHGGENMGVNSLYYLMYSLVNDWESHKTLEYLRHHVRFKVIPLKSPEDYNRKSYTNRNGVNNNRNFDWLWEDLEDNAKGPSPFSETETQVQRDWLVTNSNAFIHIDLHERAEEIVDGAMMWMGRDKTDGSQAPYTTVEQLTRRWKERHPELPDLFYGYLSQNEGPGTTRGYGSNVANIRTFLWEGFSRTRTFPNRQTSEIMTMNVEYLGNFIVNLINENM